MSVNNELPIDRSRANETQPRINRHPSQLCASYAQTAKHSARTYARYIVCRVRASPTISSRPETRPGQCIPTRIIHRGHYRPRQDKGFIIDLRLIVTLWITHACVRTRVHVCTQHTRSMCMHVTDLLLICRGYAD